MKTKVGAGYGLGPQDQRFPAKDVIEDLVKKYTPRNIWKTVIAANLSFPYPDSSRWADRVEWVTTHPEEFEEFLAQADNNLAASNTVHLILFDALDRLAEDWGKLRPIVKALFQYALDIRHCRAIRLKLFVRPDMLEDREIWNFPDASKLLNSKTTLNWRKMDLYALLFQCLANDPTNGAIFRDGSELLLTIRWERDSAGKTWVLPKMLRTDEEAQKTLFHAIAGPTMASGKSGHKRGFPYTWLPNHLADGREQVSPRSFASALTAAADHETPESWPYPIHFSGLKAGVQKASTIRVDEICEDYPWIKKAMDPLQNVVVPCFEAEFISRWKEKKTLSELQNDVEKLPPQHLKEGAEGLLKDLKSLAIIDVLADGRVQMPDVYRIAFKLKRKGGVKPVK